MKNQFFRISFLLLIVFSFNPNSLKAQKGTIKIFSEVKGINVFLDETFKGNDIVTLDSIESGTHYLKVLKDGTIIYGELIEVITNNTTAILIKDDKTLGDKILAAKTDEQNKYINNRLEVILSSGSQTFTKGASTLFPGYYSYWGFSNSVSTTFATTDWKIIKGGVKEISEYEFANITKNVELQNRINLQLKKESRRTGIGAAIAIPCMIIAGVILADMLGSKPFLHEELAHPDWEAYVATGAIVGSVIGYSAVMRKPFAGHYLSVEKAAQDAQQYNLRLKESLELPPDFESGK